MNIENRQTVCAFALLTGALLLAVATAPVVDAHDGTISAAIRGSAAYQTGPFKKGNCYSSLQNDQQNAVNSQNYEEDFDGFDDEVADNFSVKKTCKVTGIYAVGVYFGGAGPARSETVTFYADADGQPGAVESSQSVTGADRKGSFVIPLETVALAPGMHWVSVVANLDLAAGGQWGWEVTGNEKGGGNALWRNPGDGFASGCIDWADVATCTGDGPDVQFTLLK